MQYLMLATITPLHIVLFAVAAILIAALVVLGVVFACVRRKKTPKVEDVSENLQHAPAEPVVASDAEEEPAPEPVAEEQPAPAEEPVGAESDAEEEPAPEPVPEEQPAPVDEPVEEESIEEPAAEEELVAEEQPVPVSEDQPEPVPEEQPAPAAEPAPAEQQPAPAEPVRTVYVSEDGWFVRVRYDKSFEAKLIQGDAALKRRYSELKQELLSYKKVSARRSWQHEAFRLGRGPVAKLVVRGKTLRLYLALDPAPYEGSKFLVEDASEHAKFEKTPLLYRIKNDRRCRYAKELIAAAVAAAGGVRGEDCTEDFSQIPFEDTKALIDRGLVRIVEVRRRTPGEGMTDLPDEDLEDEDVTGPEDLLEEPEEESAEDLLEEPEEAPAEELAEEPALVPEKEPAPEETPVPEEEPAPEEAPGPAPAPLPDPAAEHRVSVTVAEQLMADEEAEALELEAETRSDKGRQTIVNIDTLGEYFADGERVTIEEMRERIPFFDGRATAVKVLARGVLNKQLEVEADDFSLAAVKMIALLGGKAYIRKD